MNIEKVKEVSKISDDITRRDRLIENYEKSYDFSKKIIPISLLALVGSIYFITKNINFFFPPIIFLIAMYILLIYILSMRSKKIKQVIENIKNNNEPLMYFDGEIEKLKRSSYGSRRALNSISCSIILKNPSTYLSITEQQYYEFMKNDIKKVRVYYIEELADKFEAYEVEGIREI